MIIIGKKSEAKNLKEGTVFIFKKTLKVIRAGEMVNFAAKLVVKEKQLLTFRDLGIPSENKLPEEPKPFLVVDTLELVAVNVEGKPRYLALCKSKGSAITIESHNFKVMPDKGDSVELDDITVEALHELLILEKLISK